MPHDLLSALQAKGLRPVGVSEGYSAFASVLKAQRARPDQPIVLVVVKPEQLSKLEEVFAALDRYAPKVARWSFDPQAHPPLQAARLRPRPVVVPADSQPTLTESMTESITPKPMHKPIHKPVAASAQSAWGSSGPMLRLAGLDGPVREQRDLEDVGSLLTQEEMAALLSDHSGEGTDGDPESGLGRKGGKRS